MCIIIIHHKAYKINKYNYQKTHIYNRQLSYKPSNYISLVLSFLLVILYVNVYM